MARWRIDETQNGLQLVPVTVRKLESEQLTWADLLYSQLGSVKVYVLYFPSRFDLELDDQVTDALRTFGDNTPASTSVNFWDPTDPEFSRALGFFDLESPPALLFVTGLQLAGMDTLGPDEKPFYAVTVTDSEVLRDRERLSSAANTIHEVMARGNPGEISGYLRRRRLDALLDTIGKIGGGVRDKLLLLKPKFSLPGGFSIQLG